jgi:hypothetical protein
MKFLHLNHSSCNISIPKKNLTDLIMGRDTVGSIATRYRPEDSGFEHRWVQKILSAPHPSRSDLVPTLLSLHWVPGVFPRDKATGTWL